MPHIPAVQDCGSRDHGGPDPKHQVSRSRVTGYAPDPHVQAHGHQHRVACQVPRKARRLCTAEAVAGNSTVGAFGDDKSDRDGGHEHAAREWDSCGPTAGDLEEGTPGCRCRRQTPGQRPTHLSVDAPTTIRCQTARGNRRTRQTCRASAPSRLLTTGTPTRRLRPAAETACPTGPLQSGVSGAPRRSGHWRCVFDRNTSVSGQVPGEWHVPPETSPTAADAVLRRINLTQR